MLLLYLLSASVFVTFQKVYPFQKFNLCSSFSKSVEIKSRFLLALLLWLNVRSSIGLDKLHLKFDCTATFRDTDGVKILLVAFIKQVQAIMRQSRWWARVVLRAETGLGLVHRTACTKDRSGGWAACSVRNRVKLFFVRRGEKEQREHGERKTSPTSWFTHLCRRVNRRKKGQTQRHRDTQRASVQDSLLLGSREDRKRVLTRWIPPD